MSDKTTREIEKRSFTLRSEDDRNAARSERIRRRIPCDGIPPAEIPSDPDEEARCLYEALHVMEMPQERAERYARLCGQAQTIEESAKLYARHKGLHRTITAEIMNMIETAHQRLEHSDDLARISRDHSRLLRWGARDVIYCDYRSGDYCILRVANADGRLARRNSCDGYRRVGTVAEIKTELAAAGLRL